MGETKESLRKTTASDAIQVSKVNNSPNSDNKFSDNLLIGGGIVLAVLLVSVIWVRKRKK